MSEEPYENLSLIEPDVQFKSELQPMTVDAGKNAQITVSNEANEGDSFKINWGSQNDLLTFKLWQPEGEKYVFKEVREHVMQLEPGAQKILHFRAGLRVRPFFGGAADYPFQVQVSSSKDEVRSHMGEVSDRAIIPLWVLPVVLVLCLGVICLGFYFFNWKGGQDASAATQTAMAAMVVSDVVEQTLVAQRSHGCLPAKLYRPFRITAACQSILVHRHVL